MQFTIRGKNHKKKFQIVQDD